MFNWVLNTHLQSVIAYNNFTETTLSHELLSENFLNIFRTYFSLGTNEWLLRMNIKKISELKQIKLYRCSTNFSGKGHAEL